jgi:tetratricopeptide (TPR) repeat protein
MELRGVVVGQRYTIEREIGRGGMATVWSASDRQHGRTVAIKTLHPDLAGAIGTDRFLREIRLTAELQHPGVVPILDSGVLEQDGYRIPWYAMPYLEGETLRDRLTRDTQLPIDEALRIATAVGQAVSAAHRRNIVHRDLKPENVFLAGDHAYVVDFGVAKAVAATDGERLTSTGLAIGTPAYMSPEQALAGPVDARTDQYSLAVLLYEMLAGEPPFSGPNQQAVIARRLTESARPLSTVRTTVPSHVERATLRALERTPADRFASVDAFLAALSTSGGSIHVRRRSAGRVAVLAVGGFLALAAGAWAMKLRKPAVDPEVLALYQRGVQAYDTRTAAGVSEAIVDLSAVIKRDSGFAPAWNALAKTYVRAYQRGFQLPGLSQDKLLPLAVTAVNHSLALDSSNADAWTTHGMVSQQVYPTDVEKGLRSVRRALALDSTAGVTWHFFALMTAEQGDLGGALAAWKRSVQVAPTFLQALVFAGYGHYWRGEYDSALVWVDSALSIDPNYLLAHQFAAGLHVERGDWRRAEDHALAAVRLSEGAELVNSRAELAVVKARAGSPNLARAELLGAEVLAGFLTPMPPHTALYLAEAHAALGETDAAIRSLGLYRVPRDAHFQLHLRCSPTFAPVEHDARFRAMLVIPRPAPGSHC